MVAEAELTVATGRLARPGCAAGMGEVHPEADGYVQPIDELLRFDAAESRLLLGAPDAWFLVRKGSTHRRLVVDQGQRAQAGLSSRS